MPIHLRIACRRVRCARHTASSGHGVEKCHGQFRFLWALFSPAQTDANILSHMSINNSLRFGVPHYFTKRKTERRRKETLQLQYCCPPPGEKRRKKTLRLRYGHLCSQIHNEDKREKEQELQDSSARPTALRKQGRETLQLHYCGHCSLFYNSKKKQKGK